MFDASRRAKERCLQQKHLNLNDLNLLEAFISMLLKIEVYHLENVITLTLLVLLKKIQLLV